MGEDSEGSEEEDANSYWRELKKYCLGFMGMSVREYNEILYPDLILKIEGFQDRRRQDEMMMRKVGFSAYIGSHLDPKHMKKTEQSYWSIKGEPNAKNEYKFQDKKEAFRELLEMVQNGASRN